jgi:hypothetical protein
MHSVKAKGRCASQKADASLPSLLDSESYAELMERLDYLEDSLAALQARQDHDSSLRWSEVRT